jgi:chromosome partitioning protein
MDIIVLATQKGGCGKSTLAVSLAVAAMQEGRSVRLIDTDPQGTLWNWQQRRACAAPGVDVISEVAQLEQRLWIFSRQDVAVTIIDTASGICPLTNAAIRRADLCLIPVRPSIVDIEAVAPTLGTVRANARPFAFILNYASNSGRRAGDAEAGLGDEAAPDLANVVAQPYIGTRVQHQDAFGKGLAVTELAPAGKSADEIRRLWQWVENRLKQRLPVGARTAIRAASGQGTHSPASIGRAHLPHRFSDF